MKLLTRLNVLFLTALFALSSNLYAEERSGPDLPDNLNSNFVEATADAYGITFDEAIERLAKEGEAAVKYHFLNPDDYQGFAGAWFDADIGDLVVATNSSADLDLLAKQGLNSTLVDHSLSDLNHVIGSAIAAVGDLQPLGSEPVVKRHYVDYRLNQAVIEVDPSLTELARTEIRSLATPGDIIVNASLSEIALSSSFRAADGTLNQTRILNNPGANPNCSTAAPVETDDPSADKGYVTAGHCGEVDDDMSTLNGQHLGFVEESTWFVSTIRRDNGWVPTPTRTPLPEVNGYSDGNFDIAENFGGFIEAPVGATVCRYGQASGGPFCSPVASKNNCVSFSVTQSVCDLTSVNNNCQADGDSGGAWVSSGSHIQGNHVGGYGANTCPQQSSTVFFQPITDALNRFGLILLTPHGSNPPSIGTGFCPNFSSGEGYYECSFSGADSQGETTVDWSSNTGHSSTSTVLSGNCSSGQVVTVDLDVDNPYGTSSRAYSFNCPTGPIP